MDKIVGIRSITNFKKQDIAISVEQDQIVGEKVKTSLGPSQKWTITQKLGSEPDLYSIYSASHGKYLADVDAQIALSSDEKISRWRIDEYNNSGSYQIQVYNGAVVCSLNSDDKIVLDAFSGANEQWFLNLVIPGPKRIKSIAFPDRAITYGSPAYGDELHNHSGTCMQRWTISEPNADGAYFLHNDLGVFLSWNDETAIVSSDGRLWNVEDVNHTGHYKLRAYQTEKVCSLLSRTDRASVFMRDHKGEKEEWTLEEYPVPPEGHRTGQCPGSRA